MKPKCFVPVFFLFAATAFATPDRAIHVYDQLVGFHDGSAIIRQIVCDNMGSHHDSHFQVYLIEKELATGKVLALYKIADYFENYDSENVTTSAGNSEEHLLDVVAARPDLFFDIRYALPIGVLYDIRLEGTKVITTSKEDAVHSYDIVEAFPELAKLPEPGQLLQCYEYSGYLIVLIDFGSPNGDTDYYQKIVILPANDDA